MGECSSRKCGRSGASYSERSASFAVPVERRKPGEFVGRKCHPPDDRLDDPRTQTCQELCRETGKGCQLFHGPRLPFGQGSDHVGPQYLERGNVLPPGLMVAKTEQFLQYGEGPRLHAGSPLEAETERLLVTGDGPDPGKQPALLLHPREATPAAERSEVFRDFLYSLPLKRKRTW